MKTKRYRINLQSEELDRFCAETKSFRSKKEIIKPTLIVTNKQLWRKYRYKVMLITKTQPTHLLENYDKRITGVDILQFGTSIFQSETKYALDHIISIWYGWKNNISPEIIGDISNLRYISAKENSKKGRKSIISYTSC